MICISYYELEARKNHKAEGGSGGQKGESVCARACDCGNEKRKAMCSMQGANTKHSGGFETESK